ncbi:MAG: hypothetical protein WBN40_01660 [Pseudomonadales bacterium]
MTREHDKENFAQACDERDEMIEQLALPGGQLENLQKSLDTGRIQRRGAKRMRRC